MDPLRTLFMLKEAFVLIGTIVVCYMMLKYARKLQLTSRSFMDDVLIGLVIFCIVCGIGYLFKSLGLFPVFNILLVYIGIGKLLHYVYTKCLDAIIAKSYMFFFWLLSGVVLFTGFVTIFYYFKDPVVYFNFFS